MAPRKKKILRPVIVVDRAAFLQSLNIISSVIQAMGEEFQSARDSGMDRETKRALMQVISAHLKNLSLVSYAVQSCIVTSETLNGSKDLN